MCKEIRLDKLADQICLNFYAPDCKAKSAAMCPLPTGNDGYFHDGETDEDSERVTVKVVEGIGHEEEEQGTADLYTAAPTPKRIIAANMGAGSHQKRPAHEIHDKPAERTKHTNKRVYVKTTEVEIRPLKKKKKMKGQKDQRRRALEINDNSTERAKKLTKGVWVKIIVEEIRPLTKKDESPKRGEIFSDFLTETPFPRAEEITKAFDPSSEKVFLK